MSWFKKTFNFFTTTQSYFPTINSDQVVRYWKENITVAQCVAITINTSMTVPVEAPLQWKNFIKTILEKMLIFGCCFIDRELKILHEVQMVVENNKSQYYLNGKLLNSNNFLSLPINFACLSPIIQAQKSLEIHSALMNYTCSIVQNGGRKSGIIAVAGSLTAKEQQNLINDIDNTYQKHNKTNTVYISGDYKYEPIGISLQELDCLNLKETLEKDICNSFFVPQVLLGLQKGFYMSYSEARNHFMQERIMPLLENIIENLNQFIGQDKFFILK